MIFKNVNFPNAYATWTYEEPRHKSATSCEVVLIFDENQNFIFKYSNGDGAEDDVHRGVLRNNYAWDFFGEAPRRVKGARGDLSFDDGLLYGNWSQCGEWGELTIKLGKANSISN